MHLATHGVLDAERPERSYLLMAGADESSQRLTVAEIASLNLGRNGLAVLSACETAVGEQVPGAALTTLAAAFSQAGAQSIVASLWKVNDETTRDFMVTFHRGLGTASRAAALHQAQLDVAAPAADRASLLLGAVHPDRRALAGSALSRQCEGEGGSRRRGSLSSPGSGRRAARRASVRAPGQPGALDLLRRRPDLPELLEDRRLISGAMPTPVSVTETSTALVNRWRGPRRGRPPA